MDRQVYFRLCVARDLAVLGHAFLEDGRTALDHIRGIIHVDQAIEIAAFAACDIAARPRESDTFKDAIEALPELRLLSETLKLMRKCRNTAQHRGEPPGDAARLVARTDARQALIQIFFVAGADFETFSSVQQIETKYFRDPLEEALTRCEGEPENAAALVGRVLHRVRGWAKGTIGNAMIPGEMWVYGHAPHEDLNVMVDCADKRDEFVDAMLSIAAGLSLGMAAPALIRLQRVVQGHRATFEHDGTAPVFAHEDGAERPTPSEAAWAIETLARSIIKLEDEWPDEMRIRLLSEAEAT